MVDLTGKTVTVIDNGLFTELAVALSATFRRTYYCSSWKTSFPRSNALTVGDGVDGIRRIDSIWDVYDETDLFVFPDIYHGPLQEFLRKQGKRVWGSGRCERLEYDRPNSKKWLAELGLPVGPYVVCVGMAELRRHLQKHEDVYVKSSTRGDMETFHSKSYHLIGPRLDELAHVLGAKQYDYEFVVEEKLEAEREVGYDGFTIDGEFPVRSLFGVEVKDSGYVGRVTANPPRELVAVNKKLAPVFRELHYRGFWSSEVRVSEGEAYLIDACCRMAAPPGELYTYLIENLAEVIWFGAAGELVEPEWKHKWGAQIILKSDWAEHGWQPIEFPTDIRSQVKIHYLTQKIGRFYCVPQQVPIPEIGAVVAGGDSMEEAIKEAESLAEQVIGYDITYSTEALHKAAEDM